MKCNHCNAELAPGAQFCPVCGKNVSNTSVSEESLSWGMKILSFLLPIVGIIYYFVKKTEAPKKAKDALIFGLAGVALNVIWMLGL